MQGRSHIYELLKRSLFRKAKRMELNAIGIPDSTIGV
jgi:hypothetical protein